MYNTGIQQEPRNQTDSHRLKCLPDHFFNKSFRVYFLIIFTVTVGMRVARKDRLEYCEI